jgi:hypothetical protein
VKKALRVVLKVGVVGARERLTEGAVVAVRVALTA